MKEGIKEGRLENYKRNPKRKVKEKNKCIEGGGRGGRWRTMQRRGRRREWKENDQNDNTKGILKAYEEERISGKRENVGKESRKTKQQKKKEIIECR